MLGYLYFASDQKMYSVLLALHTSQTSVALHACEHLKGCGVQLVDITSQAVCEFGLDWWGAAVQSLHGSKTMEL